jgi:hypothetical protein
VSSGEWQNKPVSPPQYSPYEGEQTLPLLQSESILHRAVTQWLPWLALPP